MVRRAPQRDSVRLRKLASDPKVEVMITTKGARRFAEASISRPDVQFALGNCTVTRSEHRHDQWRRTVRGHDIEGKPIQLVVTVDPENRKRIIVLSGERLE